MRIQVSDKTLKKLKVKNGISNLNLNLMSYTNDRLTTNICPHCLLKSIDPKDWTATSSIEFNNNCRCYLRAIYENNGC